ncbi:MAG: ribonuclease P protein component, partial [Candidatus Levybacteria bacterium]|nr:ribonuclease P protein component [Candidatus Levybacteria bacterium]
MHPVFKPQFQMKTDTFLLKGRKNDFATSRFAFVVSKRIDKRATVRNQTKRVFRQAAEQILPSIPLGYDMLFIARKALQKKDREPLFSEIQQALK